MKIKDFIYKYSIRLFILIVAYLIVSFPFQYTQEKMNDVSQPARWLGALLFFIIGCFIVRYRKKLESVFTKKSLVFVILAMIFALQLMTIYVFKIQPVNDLLYLHDEAIRMLKEPMISLQRFGGYFAHYPNNYGYLLILYCYYKVLVFCGIPVGTLVLAGNFLNLLVIDLGILCGYVAIRVVKNIKLANIWMLLFLLNPWTYFWIAYYYTHTISFGVIMVLLMLFVLIYKEKDNWKGILYSVFLGIAIYIGIKIRITNLILCIAVMITLFIFWKRDKFKARQMCLILGMAVGVAVSVFGYQYKFQNMIPKENTQEFPATHWLMMSSHGVGRYDSGDVWFTSQLPTQKQKKEKTIEKTIHNYRELGIKGTLQLSGVKLRAVWLTGDDDFTKMSYVSAEYGVANEFLNGKHNGWLLMYSYLMRMAIWCFALVAAIQMIKKRDPWNYVMMLTLLGGMIFHVFWEANPKYSICFMGAMIFMMVAGIENLCEEEKKEQKLQVSMGNIILCLIGVCMIGCLQPMHNYLKQNPEALDQSYAASQFAQSQTLDLSLKKGEAVKQSFSTKIGFENITFNLLNDKNDFTVRLLDETGKVMASARKDQLSYMQNQYEWKLNKVWNSGTYAIEIVNQKEDQKYKLPVYWTGNYDAYQNGCMYRNHEKMEKADLVFRVYQ